MKKQQPNLQDRITEAKRLRQRKRDAHQFMAPKVAEAEKPHAAASARLADLEEKQRAERTEVARARAKRLLDGKDLGPLPGSSISSKVIAAREELAIIAETLQELRAMEAAAKADMDAAGLAVVQAVDALLYAEELAEHAALLAKWGAFKQAAEALLQRYGRGIDRKVSEMMTVAPPQVIELLDLIEMQKQLHTPIGELSRLTAVKKNELKGRRQAMIDAEPEAELESVA